MFFNLCLITNPCNLLLLEKNEWGKQAWGTLHFCFPSLLLSHCSGGVSRKAGPPLSCQDVAARAHSAFSVLCTHVCAIHHQGHYPASDQGAMENLPHPSTPSCSPLICQAWAEGGFPLHDLRPLCAEPPAPHYRQAGERKRSQLLSQHSAHGSKFVGFPFCRKSWLFFSFSRGPVEWFFPGATHPHLHPPAGSGFPG